MRHQYGQIAMTTANTEFGVMNDSLHNMSKAHARLEQLWRPVLPRLCVISVPEQVRRPQEEVGRRRQSLLQQLLHPLLQDQHRNLLPPVTSSG